MPSASRALGIVRIILGALAAALVVAAVFLLIPAPELRAAQIELSLAIQGLEPSAMRGFLVIGTQAGTALRGDFLLSAGALLLLDWVLGRASRTTQGL